MKFKFILGLMFVKVGHKVDIRHSNPVARGESHVENPSSLGCHFALLKVQSQYCDTYDTMPGMEDISHVM